MHRLKLEEKNFSQLNQTIKKLESEVLEIKHSIISLTKELEELDQDTLISYWEKNQDYQSDTVKTVGGTSAGVIGGSASVLLLKGALLPLSALKILLAVGTLSVSGGLAVAGAITAHSYVKKKYLSSITIEYKGIPFAEAKCTYSAGNFVVIDSKPEQGIFKALFTPEVFSNSSYQVTILVPKNKIPENAIKIEELILEITDLQMVLKSKKEQLRKAISEKDLEKISYKALTKKISSAPPMSENKSIDLSIPSAHDSEAILKYLEKIKELSIPPETQKNTICMLLQNEKFNFDDNNYPLIIGKINDLNLMADSDIFNIIARHPQKGDAMTYGYSKEVPSKVCSFWKISILRESHMHISENEGEKTFENEIQRLYPDENEENLELRTFAYSLSKKK